MLEVRMLGQFEVRVDGKPVVISSRAAQSVLTFLLLHREIEHRRGKLAGLIWPEMEESNARSNLRHALWRLRKVLGKTYFLADKKTIAFNNEASFQLDVAILEREREPDTSIEKVASDLAVVHGDLLPGFYEDWIDAERERLQAIFQNKMQLLIDKLTERGRWRALREWCERWIAQARSPEPAYRGLMLAASGLGDLSGVAEAYQRCVEALRVDINVEPCEETQELYAQLLRGERLVEGIFEGPRHNLPTPTTPFIGREKEIDHILCQLQDPKCRLLTLLGPGGIGKTRLAIEAATRTLMDFPDGIFFIPLAPLDSPEWLGSRVADCMGFSLYGATDPEFQLLSFLHEKDLLLVFDNFEHLLDGASLITNILDRAPKVKILTTSRERLHLKQEWVFDVDGMQLPTTRDIESIEEYSAVQLFVDCAQRARSNFLVAESDSPSVVKICQLVEGMPLGIELAASWVRVLPCIEIATEVENNLDFLRTSIRDVPERHRSIRAVFEHTWSLLQENVRTVLKELSVFRGGFTRESAAKIAGADLTTLAGLVDQSILRMTPSGRYQFHKLLRQYAEDKLRQRPDDEKSILQSHCRYYAEFLKRLEEDWSERNALRQIEIELENIRKAWAWAVEHRLIDEIGLLHESLFRFYETRSMFQEGLISFGKAVEAIELERVNASGMDQRVVGVHAKVLSKKSSFHFRLGQYDPARKIAMEGQKIARSIGDQYAEASALGILGNIAYREGDYTQSLQYYEQSLQIWRALEDLRCTAILLNNIGNVIGTMDGIAAAQESLNEALDIFRKINDLRGVAACTTNLGRMAEWVGDYEKAKDLHEESLAASQEVGSQLTIADSKFHLASVACALGAYDEANTLYLSSLEIRSEIGHQWGILHAKNALGYLRFLQKDLPEGERLIEESVVIADQIGDRWGLASAYSNLGHIAFALCEYQDAKSLFTDSYKIREEIGLQTDIASAIAELGMVEIQLSNLSEARNHLKAALEIVIEGVYIPLLASVLVKVAKLYKEVGEEEDAIEILANLMENPKLNQETRDDVERLLAELSSFRSPEEFNAVTKRGHQKSIQEVAKSSQEFLTAWSLPE
jgi:predicted ATPase/DNA-binding SARP family transcriptional activator